MNENWSKMFSGKVENSSKRLKNQMDCVVDTLSVFIKYPETAEAQREEKKWKQNQS